MTKVVEAICSQGLLKPVDALALPEQQRVRLIVQTIAGTSAPDRQAAFRRLRAGIDAMNFELRGALPTRDELHNCD